MTFDGFEGSSSLNTRKHCLRIDITKEDLHVVKKQENTSGIWKKALRCFRPQQKPVELDDFKLPSSMMNN